LSGAGVLGTESTAVRAEIEEHYRRGGGPRLIRQSLLLAR